MLTEKFQNHTIAPTSLRTAELKLYTDELFYIDNSYKVVDLGRKRFSKCLQLKKNRLNVKYFHKQ